MKYVNQWCTELSKLLDEEALELVCTVQWWSQPGSVELPYREQLLGALVRLRVGLGKDSAAPCEARRVACFKLLEALCFTINTLMGSDVMESSQARSTATRRAEPPSAVLSAGAGGGATRGMGSNVTSSQPPRVVSTAAPFSDQGVPASDGNGNSALPPLRLPSRTDDERSRTEDGRVGFRGPPFMPSRGAGSSRPDFSEGETYTLGDLGNLFRATPRQITVVLKE